MSNTGTREIYPGTYELSQPPTGVIGTMWVTEASSGLNNYFVLVKGISFPIVVTASSPLTFSVADMGTITTPGQFYESSMRYLDTEEVATFKTVEVQESWEP